MLSLLIMTVNVQLRQTALLGNHSAILHHLSL